MWSSHPEIDFAPYLRGELDVVQSQRLREHLADCARCREGLAAAESVMEQLARRMAEIPAPDWAIYNAQLQRKLNARRAAAPRRLRPAWAWASLGAAVAATAAIVLTFSLSSGPQPPGVEQLEVESGLAEADIGLFRDYPVVEHLDLLENYDVIENLDQLTPAGSQHHESRPS